MRTTHRYIYWFLLTLVGGVLLFQYRRQAALRPYLNLYPEAVPLLEREQRALLLNIKKEAASYRSLRTQQHLQNALTADSLQGLALQTISKLSPDQFPGFADAYGRQLHSLCEEDTTVKRKLERIFALSIYNTEAMRLACNLAYSTVLNYHADRTGGAIICNFGPNLVGSYSTPFPTVNDTFRADFFAADYTPYYDDFTIRINQKNYKTRDGLALFDTVFPRTGVFPLKVETTFNCFFPTDTIVKSEKTFYLHVR